MNFCLCRFSVFLHSHLMKFLQTIWDKIWLWRNGVILLTFPEPITWYALSWANENIIWGHLYKIHAPLCIEDTPVVCYFRKSRTRGMGLLAMLYNRLHCKTDAMKAAWRVGVGWGSILPKHTTGIIGSNRKRLLDTVKRRPMNVPILFGEMR